MDTGYDQSSTVPLAIGEAARMLGVSVDTLRRWDDDGLIASFRTLGNQRRFHRADIEALIVERTAS